MRLKPQSIFIFVLFNTLVYFIYLGLPQTQQPHGFRGPDWTVYCEDLDSLLRWIGQFTAKIWTVYCDGLIPVDCWRWTVWCDGFAGRMGLDTLLRCGPEACGYGGSYNKSWTVYCDDARAACFCRFHGPRAGRFTAMADGIVSAGQLFSQSLSGSPVGRFAAGCLGTKKQAGASACFAWCPAIWFSLGPPLRDLRRGFWS